MRAASWPQLRVGVTAGNPRLGAAALFRIAYPRAKFHRVHTFFLPPFPRPCLIRSGRAAEAAGLVAVAAVAEVQVEAVPAVGALEAEAVEAERVEVARAAAVREVEAKAAPVELEAQEGAPEAAREGARM